MDIRARYLECDETDWVRVGVKVQPIGDVEEKLLGTEAFFPDLDTVEERIAAIKAAAETAIADTVAIEFDGDRTLPFWLGATASFVTDEWLIANKNKYQHPAPN